MTDYTDPATIDVDEVCANITHAYRMRGDKWTDTLSWPNVTVLALAEEIARLRADRDRVATGVGNRFPSGLAKPAPAPPA